MTIRNPREPRQGKRRRMFDFVGERPAIRKTWSPFDEPEVADVPDGPQGIAPLDDEDIDAGRRAF